MWSLCTIFLLTLAASRSPLLLAEGAAAFRKPNTQSSLAKNLAERTKPTTPPEHLEKTGGAFSCEEADIFNKQMPSVVNALSSQVHNSKLNDIPAPLNKECVHLNAGWWKYEFCWGRWVRQIHEENGRITAEYFLGFGKDGKKRDQFSSRAIPYADGYHSLVDKIENDDVMLPTKTEATFKCVAGLSTAMKLHFESYKQHRVQAQMNKGIPWEFAGHSDKELTPTAVSAEMTGGTMCDVTGEPRSAEVVAVCDPAGVLGGVSHDAVQPPLGFNVTEVSPCKYQIVLLGPAVCKAMLKEKTYTFRKVDERPAPPTGGGQQQRQQQASSPEAASSKPDAPSTPETHLSKVKRLIEERKQRIKAATAKLHKVVDEVKQTKEAKQGAAPAEGEQRLRPSVGRDPVKDNHLGSQAGKVKKTDIVADDNNQGSTESVSTHQGVPMKEEERPSAVGDRATNEEKEEEREGRPKVIMTDTNGNEQLMEMNEETEAILDALNAAREAGNEEEAEALNEQLVLAIRRQFQDQVTEDPVKTMLNPFGNKQQGHAPTPHDLAESENLHKTTLPGGTSVEDDEEDTMILTL